MVSFGGKSSPPPAADARATAEYAVGLVANAIAALLSLSSLVPAVNTCRNGVVAPEASVVPQMAALLNSVIWGLGGLPSVKPGSELSMGINGVCFLCMLFCTVVFLLLSGDRCFPFLIGFFFEVVVAVVGWSLVIALPGTPENKAYWIGVFGDITGVGMNLLPLCDAKRAREHQNVNHISLPTAAGALLNAVVWVIYACVNGFNRAVFVPNITGVVVWGLVLVAYFRYNQNAQEDDDQA